jgi:hypothetical protein
MAQIIPTQSLASGIEVNMHHDHEEEEHKSYMAYRNLHDIYENVEELLQMLEEDEPLEDWIEHKISTARNAISDVFSAIRYNKRHEEEKEEIISFGEWVKKKS